MSRGFLGGLIIAILLVVIVGIAVLVVRPWEQEVPIIPPTANLYSDRYVIITNYEDAAYTDYPLYVPLAFPDNIVSQNSLNCLRIRDTSGNEFPYQTENASYYSSGYVKWAGVWMLASLEPYQSQQLDLTFEDTAPDYGVFGSIAVTDLSVSITTDSFQQVQLMTDFGLAWYHIIDASGRELLTNPGVANSENSIFDIRDQEYEKSLKTLPDVQVRYKEHISNPCTVSYTAGPLFVKVSWSVDDDYGNKDSGWFRVWKSQPWIEFLTNGVAPVSANFTQAYVGYRMDSDILPGYAFNSGRLNYVNNESGTLALSCVIYTNPTNNYGQLTGGYGTDYKAEAYKDGVLRVHYAERSAYGPPVNGMLTVPLSVILKGVEPTIDDSVNRYFDRPVASYYCPDEDMVTKYEVVTMFETFLSENTSYFITTQNSSWNGQMAKAYASMVLMDINAYKYVEKIVTILEGYQISNTIWQDKPDQWPQTLPNLVESGYWVYKKTGNGSILSELQRLLDNMGVYDAIVQKIDAMMLPINKRKAFIEMMYQLKELFPEDEYAITLFNEVTAPDFLYDSDEAFNVYYYPKYELYGQSYKVPDEGHRTMDTLVTTAYILNMKDIIEYGYPLDMSSWARSYVAVQNSLWARTCGEYKDDLMFGWEHTPQDRLGHSATYANYIRIYLCLPYLFQENGHPLIAGSTTTRLSLEYLKSIQVNGLIPYASDYWLDYQSYTFNTAQSLKGTSIPAGWYGDVGVFEIALLKYADLQPAYFLTPTPAP